MYSFAAHNAATPYAETLAKKGQAIAAKPGTPVAELVRMSNSVFAPVTSKDGIVQTYGQAMAKSTEGSLDNLTMHDQEMGTYVDQLSKLVTQHISYAKNVVRPLVLEMEKSYREFCGTNPRKDPAQDFDIRVAQLAGLFKDDSFLETLSYYKDRPAIVPDRRLPMALKEDAELLPLVMTGHDRTDRLIMEWLSTKDPQFLGHVWMSFFSSGIRYKGVSFEEINSLQVFEKADLALAVHLFARKIYDDVQPTNLELKHYKTLVTQYRDWSGATLVNSLKRISLMLSTDVLVVSNLNRTLVVNGEVYAKWIDAGSDPEILLGVAISGDRVSSRAAIDANAKGYLRQWEAYETFFRAKESNKGRDYKKEFLNRAVYEALRTMDPIEQDYKTKCSLYENTVLQKSKDYIASLGDKQLEDGHTIALELVACCRFHFTSAYQILSDIAKAAEVNPDVDVREAALLAVVNYISDYIAAQLVLTDATVQTKR